MLPRWLKFCFSETASTVGSSVSRYSPNGTIILPPRNFNPPEERNSLITTSSSEQGSTIESYTDSYTDDDRLISETDSDVTYVPNRHCLASKSKYNFLNLPYDMHLEIKKHLNVKTSCQMRLVNRFCLEVYSTPKIWSRLSLKSDSSNYCLTKELNNLEIFCQNQSRKELDRVHIILHQVAGLQNIHVWDLIKEDPSCSLGSLKLGLLEVWAS